MSEYDYSPEAYQRQFETQQRISRWVDNTEANSHKFRPPVPTRSDSSDSVVTLKEPHGRMPYGYYHSGPPPGMRPTLPPMPTTMAPPPPPPPPPMQYPQYPGPMPHPQNPLPIIYQPVPVSPPPPPIVLTTRHGHSHRSSRKTKRSASSSVSKPRYTILQTPPPSPLVSPPPGSYQSFAPMYQQPAYGVVPNPQRSVKIYYI